jgi:hypothetical protein
LNNLKLASLQNREEYDANMKRSLDRDNLRQKSQFIEERDEEVEESAPNGFKSEQENGLKSALPPLPPQHSTPPAIDFKLDVKIEISSGKCVLHASRSGGEPSRPETGNSPLNNLRGLNQADYLKNMAMGGASFAFQHLDEQDMKNTNFIFPAIRVKAFYESTHKRVSPLTGALNKKANLYAMVKLESFIMPTAYTNNLMSREFFNSRDMCISPALLDFLEQTLEPLNIIKNSFESANLPSTPFGAKTRQPKMSTAVGQFSSLIDRDREARERSGEQAEKYGERKSVYFGPGGGELGGENKSGAAPAQQEASYFPVEVIVFISMLPSSIRFTCLPQSTMECLLKLPTIETVFSTNRIDSATKDEVAKRFKDMNHNETPTNSTAHRPSTNSTEPQRTTLF